MSPQSTIVQRNRRIPSRPAAPDEEEDPMLPEQSASEVEVDADADLAAVARVAPPGDPAPARLAGDPVDEAELAALVGRVVYQDQAAFEQLYRRLASRVWRQVRRLTGDQGTAEEVVEDVFWQVWRQAPRFDPARGSVLAWILQIARSRTVDALRARARSPLYAADTLDVEGSAPGPAVDDPAHRLGCAQFAAEIDVALRRLDPLRRQLVSLAFLRGLSQTEIAAHTGLPLGTVKSHLRRALATMKHALESPPPETT